MKRILLGLVLLLVAGCQPSSPATPTIEPATQGPSEIETEAPELVPLEPAGPTGAEQGGPASVAVTGDPELVFDWTTDRCEAEHIPDIAARAFLDADGMVQLLIGHYVNYRMIGPDLNTLSSDCGVLMRSDFDPEPAQFNDSEWLAAPYTEDGTTIYALVHNEYRGDTHSAARPGQCPSGDRLTCLDTSVTMAISTDGGDSYQDILAPPNHMVATMPYVFNDEGVPSGLRQPSNIIKDQEGYYYNFTNISDYPENPGDFPPQWTCVMRTDDLSDPASWRYWDGQAFAGEFVNPYLEGSSTGGEKCAPLDLPDLSGSINEAVTFNNELGRYMMVGFSNHPTSGDPHWGYYYSLSDDLIHWTQRELIVELPGTWTVPDLNTDLFFAYPSVIDPDSSSMNFETTDGEAYLYLTRFNVGISLDRDLVRFPIEITPPTYSVPSPWRFDADGEAGGWEPTNQITSFEVQSGSLAMRSTGDDPSMEVGDLAILAAEYDRLGIRMSVSPGQPTTAQLFFGTDTDSALTEEKSIYFDVIVDGEFHDYVLDLSALESWDGVITHLRLDPVWTPGRDIRIDLIAFVE